MVGAAHRTVMSIPAHPIRRFIVRSPPTCNYSGPPRIADFVLRNPAAQELTLPRTVTLEPQNPESLPVLIISTGWIGVAASLRAMRCPGRAAGRSIPPSSLAPRIKGRDWSGKIAGKYRIPSTSAFLESAGTRSVHLETFGLFKRPIRRAEIVAAAKFRFVWFHVLAQPIPTVGIVPAVDDVVHWRNGRCAVEFEKTRFVRRPLCRLPGTSDEIAC